MKKKSVIAVLSIFALATAFGAAGCSGTKGCEHPSWTTKIDGEYHYQQCDNCGIKETSELHVDVKNNETQADGADGKCDVCDATIKFTVTFDLDGKGEIASKSVEYGKKADKPEDPTYSGYAFVGWYADSEFNTPFDFTQPITSATTIYAKWEKDETPVPGSDEPITVELDKSNFNISFGKAQKLYFKFTAKDAGRYQVNLSGAAAEKCAYTTDIDDAENTVKSNGVTYFDLAANGSVAIEVTRGENVEDDERIMVYATTVVNEPLPAEGWLAGRYSDLFAEMTVDFKKDGTLIFNDSETVTQYNYVGGIVNTLSFEFSESKYTVKYSVNADNEKVLTLNFGNKSRKLVLEEEQEPIAIAKFSGKYEPVGGNKIESINLINIYDDGTGYFLNKQNAKVKMGTNEVSFNQKINKLIWGSTCVITLNLNEQGTVESISVATNSGSYVYNRTGDADVKAPESLPLPEVDAEYRGEQYGIVTIGEYQYYKNLIAIDITAFDGEFYFITYKYGVGYGELKEEDYKLKIVTEGDDVTAIEWYDTEGTKLDTLNKIAPTYHDLVTEEYGTTISVSDLEYGSYFFKAEEKGTYKITATAYDTDNNYIACDVEVKYNVLAYNIDGTGESLSENGVVSLEKGAIVKVTCSVANPSITFICTKLEEGMIESKPIVLENGYGEVEGLASEQNYYFTYTAPKAGKYMVLCSTVSYGQEMYLVHYKVNGGDDCGYGLNGWSWYEGFSFHKPYYIVDVPADNLTVNLCVITSSFPGDVLKVSISEAAESYTQLTFDDENKGSLTASGAYNYNPLADDDMAIDLLSGEGLAGVKFTCGSSMTITALGSVKTGTEIILSVKEVKFGFKIECTGTVNYSIAAKLGSLANPYKITELGTTEVEPGDSSVYYNITAPSDTDIKISVKDMSGYGVYFDYEMSNGETGYCMDDNFIIVAAGESVTISFYPDSLTSIIVAKGLFVPAEYKGAYTYGESGELKIGTDTVTIGDKVYTLTSVSGSEYTFTCDAETITLTLSETEMKIGEETLEVKIIFTEEQAGEYTGGSEYVTYILSINQDGSGTYTIDNGYRPFNENITVEVIDGGYAFSTEYFGSFTFTFDANGNVVLVNEDGEEFTLYAPGNEPDPDPNPNPDPDPEPEPEPGILEVATYKDPYGNTELVISEVSETGAKLTYTDMYGDTYEAIVATKSENEYSFSYVYEGDTYNVTFKVYVNGTIALVDGDSTPTLEKQ